MADDTERESGPVREENAGIPEEKNLETRLAELEEGLRAKSEEASRNFDLYVRERADAENFKKRLQRDKLEAIRFGNEGLVREILPVLDSLELALEHSELGGNGKSVVEGVQMVLRMFRDVLERHGVTRIDVTEGTTFDPQVHEAAALEAAEGKEPNTVIRMEQRGYKLHDRVLRPARVTVSAAARKPPEESSE